jgi:hypothetical protein
MNEQTDVCRFPDGRKLTVTDGDKILFRAAVPNVPRGDAATFELQNELLSEDIGKSCGQGVVAAFGGSATVTVAQDGSYTVNGRTEGP